MYSEKFRKEILRYYHNGHTYRDTCTNFGISQDTLARWVRDEKSGITVKPERRGRKQRIDRNRLREYVDAHPDAYQREIAEELGCSQPTVCYALKSLGYTLKKRPVLTKNRIL